MKYETWFVNKEETEANLHLIGLHKRNLDIYVRCWD